MSAGVCHLTLGNYGKHEEAEDKRFLLCRFQLGKPASAESKGEAHS